MTKAALPLLLLAMAGCELAYFVREPVPIRRHAPDSAEAQLSGDEALLERGERVSSRFDRAQESARRDVTPSVYYVRHCRCYYCWDYRTSYGFFPWPWSGYRYYHWRVRRPRWGWGIWWGW
jgi:hypothetical protein